MPNELTKSNNELLEQLKQQGGVMQGESIASFPQLKLEHTTDFSGEPNPLKGHFTLSIRDSLGIWDKKDLGEMITLQFLLQRYILSLRKNDTNYSSKEFGQVDEHVQLFKTIGDGENRKTELYKEATPVELGKDFLVKDAKGHVRSELKLLVVLYAKYNNQTVRWKTNLSATMAYLQYAKQVIPFAVNTEITREEAKNGANKFYKPKFKAINKLTDYQQIIKEQNELIKIVTSTEESAGVQLPPITETNIDKGIKEIK